MPTTRKKVIKTVYKDEDDSEVEDGDFSDSGSEAVISQPSSSDDENEPDIRSKSSEVDKKKNKIQKAKTKRKSNFNKTFVEKINKSSIDKDEVDSEPEGKATFSVKDLTEADKLLPSFLNLSESESSDDDDSKNFSKPLTHKQTKPEEVQSETIEKEMEYHDIWSCNLKESEEIAQRAFLELEKHKTKLEEAKKSVQTYTMKKDNSRESDVKDLLALGEDVMPSITSKKMKYQKLAKEKIHSDSEIEDWEEVADGKPIPQQGLQLIVDFPGAPCRKSKKLDVEMMMKRKINRVKKEYQVYMHKVHVLCWLGHGNYVSQVLNDQDVLSAALSLIPTKECYPGERVDMKYVEQITTWFKDKLTIKYDKHEGKFRPKALPLKNILLQQIKSRAVTSKKYVVFIFVSMLRAVGLQCRIMLNFTTLPIKPPATELCCLSTKAKSNENDKEKDLKSKELKKESKKKLTNKRNKPIPQLDGNYDSLSDSECDNIIQLDGNDDIPKCIKTPVTGKNNREQNSNANVSPPKRTRRNLSVKKNISDTNKESGPGNNSIQVHGNNYGSRKREKSPMKEINKTENKTIEEGSPPKRSRKNLSANKNNSDSTIEPGLCKADDIAIEDVSPPKRTLKNLSVKKKYTVSTKDLGPEDNIIQLDRKNDSSEKDHKIPVNEIKKIKSNPIEDGIAPNTTASNLRPKNNSSGLKSLDSIRHLHPDDMITEGGIENTCKYKKSPVKGTNKMENKITDKRNHNEDTQPTRPRRNLSIKKRVVSGTSEKLDADAKNTSQNIEEDVNGKCVVGGVTRKSMSLTKSPSNICDQNDTNNRKTVEKDIKPSCTKILSQCKTKNFNNSGDTKLNIVNSELVTPKIIVTNNDTEADIASQYFDNAKLSDSTKNIRRARQRSNTTNPKEKQNVKSTEKEIKKPRAKSVPGTTLNKSKYFDQSEGDEKVKKISRISRKNIKTEISDEDSERVSHRDLAKSKLISKTDVRNDLVDIMKKRVREAKDARKDTSNISSGEDSDYLPESTKQQKISNNKRAMKSEKSRKIDRRVISTDDEVSCNKMDVWCEVYVEELEQWIAVDIIKGRVHCVNEIYSGATHPSNYIVGWDNNNYLKDLTRRYVPHWNTVTRKQRVEATWWNTAVQPWLGPRTPRDKEEDESLDRMQLDAPLPKSIAEYKNHPLYALKRHLLKFEALYPPDAATLGFVRGEAVYARECVYVCRSRDTWLKEAKVVRLGEQPYKVVKARPKWDKLSNKLITDKPLEVFGPWQVQDYEPPVAENGIVPRNAYGNVELFKECMLPKGTVHIKLPGLNRVARKLNIDCAPAMTGFDFNGGWSHPVYDGFVVCKEFEDIITNAWHEDQLEQERKEQEKLDARVYGNWRRLIKGLLIRERLKLKYGFTELSTTQNTKKKSTVPKLTVKKKCLGK